MNQEALSIERRDERLLRLNYLRSLPADYGKEPGKKWPLILFLHGAGERGSDLELVKKHGIPKVAEQRDLPFVTLSPQCPLNHWWSDFLPALDALLEETVQTLDVDPTRIYLTGLSMGGFGTWHMAVTYPNRFAAIAPICGGFLWMVGFPERLEAITHLPTWIFHGALDEAVSVMESAAVYKHLKACGGNVKITIYPEAGHDAWTETYDNPALYDWFLEHRRAE